jgi:hypothetical protein
MVAELGIPHALVSIAALEPIDLLVARFEAAGKQCQLRRIIHLSKPAFDLQSKWLNVNCEFYDYSANKYSTDPLQGE